VFLDSYRATLITVPSENSMNAAEHFICSSSLWRSFTQRQLLPWLLSGAFLGDYVLEIGAGYGAATTFLKSHTSRVTSLEYDYKSALKLKLRNDNGAVTIVQGDAAHLPFACETFSSAIAILVLHHLKSPQLQEEMLAESFRVLRPGGVFLVFEITDSWFHRLGHIRSTFTPVAPASVFQRLNAVGFSKVALDVRKGGFRVTAIRPTQTD
jgi:ubiquinone/menaquinone biosynthesis C-methylase UbiE